MPRRKDRGAIEGQDRATVKGAPPGVGGWRRRASPVPLRRAAPLGEAPLGAADRIHALTEARRVLRPDGVVFAAAISRFAALFDLLVRLDRLHEDEVFRVVADAVATGVFRGSEGGLFTTAYFHRPSELRDEVREARFTPVALGRGRQRRAGPHSRSNPGAPDLERAAGPRHRQPPSRRARHLPAVGDVDSWLAARRVMGAGSVLTTDVQRRECATFERDVSLRGGSSWCVLLAGYLPSTAAKGGPDARGAGEAGACVAGC